MMLFLSFLFFKYVYIFFINFIFIFSKVLQPKLNENYIIIISVNIYLISNNRITFNFKILV